MTAVILQFPVCQALRQGETTLGLSYGAIDFIDELSGQVTVNACFRAQIGWKVLSLIQSDPNSEIRFICQFEEGGDVSIEASVPPGTAAAIRAMLSAAA